MLAPVQVMGGEIYQWLVEASLRLLLVLPVVMLVAWGSRRTSSALLALWLVMGLGVGLVAPLLGTPSFLPSITVPALVKTGAFEAEIPASLRSANHLEVPSLGVVPRPSRETPSVAAIALTVWAAGMLVFACQRLWRYFSQTMEFARAEPVATDHPSVAILERASRGLARRPWLFHREDIPGPLLQGLLQPRVLVPSSFLGRDPGEQELILVHEIEHFRRRDLWKRAGLELLAIVFWFHPLVHLLLRRHDLAVEMACDDAVLRDGVPAARFGELLVAEARQSGGARRSMREARLRLLAVLRPDKRRARPSLVTRLGSAAVFVALLLPLALVRISPFPRFEPFEPMVPDDRVGALWRMRVGRGDVVDDWSGHGRHGRIIGAEWVRDEERGYCLSFDGEGDILVLPEVPSDWTLGGVTVAMWLKLAPESDGGGLLLRGDFNQTWCMAVAHMGGSNFQPFGERELLLCGEHGEQGGSALLSPGTFPTYNAYGISEEQADAALPTDRWVHLAVVISSVETFRDVGFYVDGRPAGRSRVDLAEAPAFNFDWLASNWIFGRGESPPVHGNYYEGRLSDLVVVPEALEADRVGRLMRAEFDGLFAPNP